MAPSWMKMSNVLAVSPVSPSQWLARIRWPVELTGMNSVTPSIRPSTTAVSRGSATIGRSADGAPADRRLVQRLVHRDDPVGRELAGLGDRRLAHGGVPAG